MKWFALLGLLLFLGVAVAQSINANGSIIQSSNFDAIMGTIQDKLSDVSSVERTIKLYKDIIIELDENRLLSRGLNAEIANEIIFRGFDRNKHHLVCGYTNNTLFNTFFHHILIYGSFLTGLLIFPIVRKLITVSSPIDIRANVAFGYTEFDYFKADVKMPTYGWINIIGLNGKEQWNGSFYGQFQEPYISDFLDTNVRNHCGLRQFTGIRIGTFYGSNYFEGNSFFIGYASEVSIGHDYPL